MTATTRSLGTMALAVIVFVGGLALGFRLLTAEAETIDAQPTCTQETVAAGEPLTSNLVTVNVFNNSNRSGLANRVTINLQRVGFLGGEIGNSESAQTPEVAAILTSDPDDPRVRLVAAQFGEGIRFAESDLTVEEGVIVILGDGFEELVEDAPTEIESDRDLTMCVPSVQLP